MLILNTKLMLPRRGRGVLPRPRLEKLAQEVAEHRVTILKAPPGYGKTTLARAWADELGGHGAKVAWLSTDEADADANRLATYVAATFHRVMPTVGGACLELCSASATWKPEHLLSSLLNEVCEQDEEVFLFLDDFHHLVGKPSEGLLTLLLKHAPANLHIVFIGRCDAPSALAQAFLRSEAKMVDAGELRFSLEETAQLLEKSTTQQHEDSARLLQNISNGWAAALRVLMLSLTHHQNPSGYLSRVAASNRPLNTLIGDLLEQLPGELTDFMMAIAITERTCSELAQTLTSRPDAQSLIEQIESLQLFLLPLDDERHWFAFHPIFREYLARRLLEHAPDAAAALHHKAARWFAQREYWRSAVAHAVEADAAPMAMQWIEQCAMKLVEQGDMLTLIVWDRQLQTLRLASPLKLRLAMAWAYALGMECAESRMLLGQVLAGVAQGQCSAEELPSLTWQCKVLDAMLLVFEDRTAAATVLAAQAMAEPHHDRWVSYVMLNVLAFTHGRAARWQDFYGMPTYAEQIPGNERYVFNLAYRHCIRGMINRRMGMLGNAEEALRATLNLDQDSRDVDKVRSVPTSHTVFRALGQSALCEILYERDQLQEASRMVQDCLPIIRNSGPLDFVWAATLTHIRLVRLGGDKRRWRSLLDEAETWADQRGWTRMISLIVLERLHGALVDRQETEAGALVRRIESLAQTPSLDEHARTDIVHHAALARMWHLLSCGITVDLIDIAEQAYESATRAGLAEFMPRLAIALAIGHALRGEMSLAHAVLSGAITRLATENAVKTVTDTPVQRPLLAKLLRHLAGNQGLDDATSRYLHKVIAALGGEEAGSSLHGQRLSMSLSIRERQILRMVAEGASNKQIAKSLGVAPDTVKYHLKGVFSKLSVDSRTQAAALAHQLQLGDPCPARKADAPQEHTSH
ncbi:LuxR C-terminal-related transcriptional regulator [Ideonella sp. B508-1]|uniref:LuxR C-terminal-related transcriptional regulator n=1 Tax=Ideonella sp. B508-1 TaxID=137716 RepID=UPI00034948EF|nr:LuxR C-terminal-related transcriptional regulator [Ideonella sp. B508-1]